MLAGRVIDKIGTKKGYSWATGLWSIAAIIHAFAKNVFGFAAARAALGITEAGNFPAAIKTTAEWFPKKERACEHNTDRNNILTNREGGVV
jgi:ACS family hexuronate transporter-like MFS transporter